MKKTVIFLVLACAISGCDESLMDSAVNTGTPVVESYLQAGSNSLTVKVYGMEIYLKDDYELSWPIEGLQLEINGRELTETAQGTYSLSLGGDTVRELQNYELSFEYRGKTVSASTSVPKPVTGLSIEPAYITRTSSSYFWDSADTAEIKLTWDDPDNSYYQLYIESPAASDMPTLGGGAQFRRRMMQPFRGNSYTTVSREFMSAGDYLIHVYRVNKDYVDLYERISVSRLRGNELSCLQ